MIWMTPCMAAFSETGQYENWQEVKWEKEGDGIGKSPQARTRTPTHANDIRVLPKRLLALTSFYFIFILPCNVITGNLGRKQQSCFWWRMQDFSNHLVHLNPLKLTFIFECNAKRSQDPFNKWWIGKNREEKICHFLFIVP